MHTQKCRSLLLIVVLLACGKVQAAGCCGTLSASHHAARLAYGEPVGP
jgi:hypothetical protein